MSFVSLRGRVPLICHDATGFCILSSNVNFYFGFDVKYTDISTGFCISTPYVSTFYATLRNLDFGAKAGYFKVLHVKGIGFKVFQSLLRRSLYFFLGYNHVTKYKFTELVDFRPLKGHVLVFSVQKALFGSTIYQLRHLRYPDPYRGKGIRYRFQLMRFKPGKQR